MLKRFMVVALVAIMAMAVGVPKASAAGWDTLTTCHSRNMYQWGGYYVLWHMTVCATYEEKTNAEGNVINVSVVPGTARIWWTPHGLSRPFWSANNCAAWSFKDNNGVINVKGSCDVSFKYLLTSWSSALDVMQRTVWDGFTIDGGNTDYLYSRAVDYRNENQVDPLPMDSPSGTDDCGYYADPKPNHCGWNSDYSDWYA